MRKPRVLYVSHEIIPFLPESEIAKKSRELPQYINTVGKETRIFMPRFGCINERRHQLHEVIRLSGMNLIIDDMDHPLIIKVASIPTAKIQVYFIDSEEYFQRKAVLTDNDDKFFKDNDERSIFFCKGVIETVKKLGWSPDIVHCHGWMSAFMPLYLKKMHYDDPHFMNSKVVYSVYESGFPKQLNKRLKEKLVMDGFEDTDVDVISKPTFANLNKLAIDYADAVIQSSENVDSEVLNHAKNKGNLLLNYTEGDKYIQAYTELYDSILEEENILAD